PLPRGYTGTVEATTLVLLVLLDCLLVSSSRPFRSSSGGPPMCDTFRTLLFSPSAWTRLHLSLCFLPLLRITGCPFEVPVPTSLPSLRPSFVSSFRPLPCGYTGTMEATTLVLLVLLDCLFVSSSRPFHSSSGGPPMVCNFIKSDVEES
ncbi:unnamed protein product, partial [Boreogadus saida]